MKKTVPKDAVLIPDNATKVFEGNLFDVYQWPQQMFDGSTKTFEMLKRADTVQVVAIKDGKIVLVKDEQPGRNARTHFPGGQADPGDDSWLDAAKREMREETGLSFKNWRLIGVEQPAPKIEWFTPWFLATDLESESNQELDTDGERIKVIEWAFDDIRKYVLESVEPTLNYAVPLMIKATSIEDLLATPEFAGKEVNR